MPYICLCAHYVHSYFVHRAKTMHMCISALPPSLAFDITRRRSWKCTYTHVHCLCDCVTVCLCDCVTVWHNAGVSFPSWGCLTQAHALWPCSAASSCSFYTFPAVFSLTRVQLGNMCKARQLHIFKLYCAKNPTHPDLAALYMCHLGFEFVSFCFFVSS